jgi:hypothetical protein
VPAADAAFLDFLFRGSQAGLITFLNARSNFATSCIQVEKNGRRNDRYLGHYRIVTETSFLEVAHNAAGGIETESTAAAEEYGLNFFHQIPGPKKVGLSGSGRRAPDINPGYGTGLA